MPLRALRQGLLIFVVSLVALLVLVVVTSQVEQHIFRRGAEHLLSQLQSLDLRKTTWQEARERLKGWGADQQFDERCNTLPCSLDIEAHDLVWGFVSRRNLLIKLDDYFRWRLRLTYNTGPFERMQWLLFRTYVRLGGHPAHIDATVRTRDGLVWKEEFQVAIETYGHPIGWSGFDRIEFELIADVESVPRLDRHPLESTDLQVMLHPDYVIGTNPCDICVLGWVNFTPYASSSDVRRLMSLDLSCLSSWHHCLTQNDIMPVAWNQYLAEQPILDGSESGLSCPARFLEAVGRDSAGIADVEIVSFQDKSDDGPRAVVRLRKRVKGVLDWEVGDIRDVSIWSNYERENLNLRPLTEVVLFRNWLSEKRGIWQASLPPCPIAFATQSNLRSISNGIAQDYTAPHDPN